MAKKNNNRLYVDTPADKALAMRFAKGEKTAFNEIYARFALALGWFTQKYTNDVEEAADIVQDVFIKLWERREHFDSLHYMRGFLYRAVKNQAIDHRRKNTYRGNVLLDLTDSLENDYIDYEKIDFETEIYKALLEAIEKLPAHRKQVFKLSFYEQLTTTEIAARLGISEENVRSHKRYAVRDLKEKFKDSPLIMVLLAMSFLSEGLLHCK